MSQNITALREKIAEFSRLANQLVAEKGSATWTPEEQAKFDGYANEVEAGKAAIKNIETLREMEAEKFFQNAAKDVKKPEDGIDALAAVALYMRNGTNVTPEQAFAIRNAMSTTTSAEGGYTVPSEIAAMVIDALKAFGGMREVSQIINTAGGNSLNFPTSDGTSEVGVIVAENAAASTGEITFGTVAVNPYKYSSNKIAIPWELIQDSAIDVVSFVTNRLATRLARITNTHYTTGDGSSKPYGVMARAATGKTGATGTATSITYDDIVDLIHSVNRAYRTNGARFMLADSSVAIIRKLKDTTGRPIWVPGDMEGITGGTPSTIAGHAYTVNDDVAAMAANAKSVAFGDFSQFVIRDVSNSTSILRFDDSAFALNGQVGFCGWLRTGSNLLNAAAVKVFVNAAS